MRCGCLPELGNLDARVGRPGPLLVISRTHHCRWIGAEVDGTVEQERKAPSLALCKCRDMREPLIFGQFLLTKEPQPSAVDGKTTSPPCYLGPYLGNLNF